MRNNFTFIIVANEAGAGKLERTLSGGDRIVIELAKNFSKRGVNVKILTSISGYHMYRRYLSHFDSFIITYNKLRNSRLWNCIPYIAFYWLGLMISSMRMSSKVKADGPCVVYSASEYIVDLFPSTMLKRRLNAKLIGTFYLFAPTLTGDVYRGLKKFRGLFYYVMQLITFNLVKKFADMVFVNNEDDRIRIIDSKKFTEENVISIGPGVDLSLYNIEFEQPKAYDAVFIGRFHPQKGVLELIDVWKIVCDHKPNAKLVIIGVGYLEPEIRRKIQEYGLTHNVEILGFKDGIEKIKIFMKSKIVLHPAIYDSGGMAAAEAMACGLPGVSFDLPALRTYYPKGMLKTPCYDLNAFAENILRLLEDHELYRKVAKDALDLAKEWDWNKKAQKLLETIRKMF